MELRLYLRIGRELERRECIEKLAEILWEIKLALKLSP